MVCKDRGMYDFLCPSWVLITMAPRTSRSAGGVSAGGVVYDVHDCFVFCRPPEQKNCSF